MSLHFQNKLIPGTHGQIVAAMPTIHTRREHFWGTKGELEIWSGPGTRELMVSIWIFYQFDTFKKCDDFIRYHDTLIGTHSTLYTTDGNNTTQQEFFNCTFEGIELVALEGQQEPGILQDIAGTVETPAGYWFAPSLLRFTQISII